MQHMRSITLSDRELHAACEREEWFIVRRISGRADLSDCPYGKIGEILRVQERLWISDCGDYYAQDARSTHGDWRYDVVTIDGSTRYFNQRYDPSGWEDTDPRYLYPEFPRMVNSWSNKGHYLRNGRFVLAFKLGFGEYNTNTKIKPLTGNTQLSSYTAEFHNRIPGHKMPDWAERLQIKLTEIKIAPFEDILHDHSDDWKQLYWAFQEHESKATIEKNPLVWVLFYQRVSLKDFAEGACPHVAKQ
jgi:hypothetical protein